MKFEIETDNDKYDDILQCLEILYSTNVGTSALNRDFGLDTNFLDMPIQTAKNLMTAEIIKKTIKYEPRANVQKILWEKDFGGQLKAKVIIKCL